MYSWRVVGVVRSAVELDAVYPVLVYTLFNRFRSAVHEGIQTRRSEDGREEGRGWSRSSWSSSSHPRRPGRKSTPLESREWYISLLPFLLPRSVY